MYINLIILLCIKLILLRLVFSEEQRPNILLIVADDLGWGDVSFHESNQIQTPNIDTLASDGIILNNYYVSPICSPSRSALLTGYHPINTGLQHFVLNGAEPWGVPLKYKMLPQHLRNLGYATVAIGKWHQGFFQKEYIPTNRGFDSHFGYWTGHEDYYDRTSLENWWGLDFRRNENPINCSLYKDMYSTEIYTTEAVNTIINHTKTSEKPLFLYLAHQAVHAGNSYNPLQSPQKYTNKYASSISDHRRRTFAGMVSALDDSIGKIISALDFTQILNNTIIIFTTDNGAATGGKSGYIDGSIGSNWPLRGAKYTLFEGGIRGVGFIWSADLTKQYVSDHLMHINDWMPTIYKAAGGNITDLGPIDGIDYWNVLKQNLTSPRNQLLHNIDDKWNVWAVRSGDYKLISGTVFDGDYDGWFVPPGLESHSKDNIVDNVLLDDNTVRKILMKIGRSVGLNNKKVKVNCNSSAKTICNPTQVPCLFNIRDDPCEYNNIALQKPDIVQQLKSLMLKYNSTAVPPGNKPANKRANPTLHNYRWDIWD